jgi:manganese oxidase
MNMDMGSHAIGSLDGFEQVATGVTRHYYIEAKEIDWQYAPAGKNEITGLKFTSQQALYAENGPWGTGKTYKKCVYRGYSDKTFSKEISQPAYMGLLGPTIYAEVGDRVQIDFKNSCRFDDTVHVHGLEYDKASEGAPYQDGTNLKADDDVKPGTSYTYNYKVPESAGPAAMDGSTAMWMYHSHNDEVQDVYAGLTGFIVVTKHGMAKKDGTPKDVDQMVFSLFEIFDENQSRLANDNFAKVSKATRSSDDFVESNLKHSINGYIYGNGPMPVLKAGTNVRWFLMDMGNEVDEHTPHWHGNTAVVNGMRTDVVSMLPGMMVTADMNPYNKGIWLFHCHVADHLTAGMIGRYQVK